MADNNNNNSNVIELLSDSDDDEKKPAAVDKSTASSAKPQPRANMLCQFFKRTDTISTTVVATRKQPTPKKRAIMNGIADNKATPHPVLLHGYPEPDFGRNGYDLELTGPPEAWSRPSFMAWFGEDGRLLRRVVNANRKKQDHLRRMVTGMLMENYSVNPADHPIFKKGVPVAVELEFHRRPPNDDFIANNRQNYFKDRIMHVILVVSK